ncbi:hypothetical protein Ccar_16170 [Clostridium carboxidivorans P7]|uniref:Uncharacterized protein n=1 Tax=Clostridium carboxidivorans P7 TaxID=536227 RepID=C6Q144_9CLOT|nr:hypothetical protein [Clostridium carboxidivorans]AKN32315.1 hypothetical protein Ccar_16170 [Clostridium carboxidivorans P7]EET84780.1 hypothetical protein CcarbDRAFT_4761 [Clostridium carboxidivorans P7]
MVYTFEENINKLTYDGLNYQRQMDATTSDGRNVLNWDEVDPKVFDFKYNKYKCWSKLQSGINTVTNNFILQSKTWFYKLEIKVKNTCYIKHAWVSDSTGGDGFLNIDKTYSSGDEITLYMVKLMELKCKAEDVEITAYYIPPFIEFWNISGKTKEEIEANKKKYLISNQIGVGGGGYVWFQNGLQKFVMDNTVSEALKITGNNSQLYLWNCNSSWGKTENMFYIFQNPRARNLDILYSPDWFESEDE